MCILQPTCILPKGLVSHAEFEVYWCLKLFLGVTGCDWLKRVKTLKLNSIWYSRNTSVPSSKFSSLTFSRFLHKSRNYTGCTSGFSNHVENADSSSRASWSSCCSTTQSAFEGSSPRKVTEAPGIRSSNCSVGRLLLGYRLTVCISPMWSFQEHWCLSLQNRWFGNLTGKFSLSKVVDTSVEIA